ncbi:50S ribosomal protein L13P [Methanocaldococcus villosus KIN24-T80]|uniref:Large ribosomal subunit protein uL13 n=1 Tax=Methanocaldococcus villosus KIN24-T80 TaxID=1069083 RepID=N6VPZ4_9EURY|nr:50S ribosomal protein L13 [Methanocaldococcus villosus]ENN95965.1 50S ribosomal protein L13P [Methanocaldococcus villosus KIN24-T80]
MTVIDAEGAILGRLASTVAKRVLRGEEITIINAEKVIITGNRDWIIKHYQEERAKKNVANPRRFGPKFPRRPDDILRRTIRKMLPYKKPKGREAFKRVKVYVGNPLNLQPDEKISHELKTNKFITLGELSKHLGAKF